MNRQAITTTKNMLQIQQKECRQTKRLKTWGKVYWGERGQDGTLEGNKAAHNLGQSLLVSFKQPSERNQGSAAEQMAH